MDSLQTARVRRSPRIPGIEAATCGQSLYASVGDILAFDKPNAAELRQTSQKLYAVVSDESTAGQVNVADAVAVADKLFQSFICDLTAASEVDIVKVLAELAHRED